MIVSRGMLVESLNYGLLRVVCVTREWLIGENEAGTEFALERSTEHISIPADLTVTLAPDDSYMDRAHEQ